MSAKEVGLCTLEFPGAQAVEAAAQLELPRLGQWLRAVFHQVIRAVVGAGAYSHRVSFPKLAVYANI